MIEMNRENFKTILKDMVSDYPELQVKVGKKGYGYRQIAQTIEEYNEYSAPKGAFLGMN
ncbi:MAG: putative patatin/cPLA2 family phospholipase [Saprospiraceae bacterium]|jgi:predicted patatin/cPLA2 family phospholipase